MRLERVKNLLCTKLVHHPNQTARTRRLPPDRRTDIDTKKTRANSSQKHTHDTSRFGDQFGPMSTCLVPAHPPPNSVDSTELSAVYGTN